jgi:hypothetical protein
MRPLTRKAACGEIKHSFAKIRVLQRNSNRKLLAGEDAPAVPPRDQWHDSPDFDAGESAVVSAPSRIVQPLSGQEDPLLLA